MEKPQLQEDNTSSKTGKLENLYPTRDIIIYKFLIKSF